MSNKKSFTGQLLLNIFFIILCSIIIIPFLFVVSASFSDEMDIAKYGYELIPRNFTLDAYKYVFSNPTTIIDAYKVTIAFSVLGTFLSVLLTAMVAYPLSQKVLRCRNKISFYLYFTCLFSGGLVPAYLLNTKYLNLDDTFWIYILPSCVSAFYVFMMRTSFSEIPNEIIESVLIDGSNDYVIFFKFILPLSKPIVFSVSLFALNGIWGDFLWPYLILRDEALWPTGVKIYKMAGVAREDIYFMSLIFVMLPPVIIYLTFQKYLMKGLSIGGVKG